MTNNPRVTVLMSVYNAEQYLSAAIESILKQTYSDFEFLIIDDASTDKSVDIISSYNDARIRLIHNETNLKLAASLNKGIELAKGVYIARMDADDISLPGRLKKQVKFMDENKEVDICGTLVQTMGLDKNFIFAYPTDADATKVWLLFRNALAHPSVIFRKEKLIKYNLQYNTDFVYVQDYDLWSRCSKKLILTNINDVLVKYRCNEKVINLDKKALQQRYAMQIFKTNLHELEIDNDQFVGAYCKNGQLDLKDFYIIIEGLREIIRQNEKKKIYSQCALHKFISSEIEEICRKSAYLGFKVLQQYCLFFKNEKRRFFTKYFLVLFIKCIKNL